MSTRDLVPRPAPMVRVRQQHAVLLAWVRTPRRGLWARIAWPECEPADPGRWGWRTAEVDASEVAPLRGQSYRHVPREDQEPPDAR